ncbi:Uncharacterised protein [uncultured archaeon]|nr:Uncharacterised protein [uncultured archaeon]
MGDKNASEGKTGPGGALPREKLGILGRQEFAYGLLIAFFIFYLVSGNWIFGALVGLALVWAVVLEFAVGAKQHGLVSELKETAIALLIALAVWYGAGFLLQTSSPLNAIVSCSMLPHIQRGDMVLLSGDRLNAPLVDLPPGAIDSLGYDAVVYENGVKVEDVKGSMYSYCSQHRSDKLCDDFVATPEKFTEKRGPLTFGYEKCEILYPKSGMKQAGPCVNYLEVDGVKYYENLSNDVVVYAPPRDEIYSRVGDIIHRAYIKLNDSGKTYFLTKGDNNPVFDIQVYDEGSGMGNRPVELSQKKGRVLVTIPYLGYFKLFISPSAIPTPEGCDRYFSKYAS